MIPDIIEYSLLIRVLILNEFLTLLVETNDDDDDDDDDYYFGDTKSSKSLKQTFTLLSSLK